MGRGFTNRRASETGGDQSAVTAGFYVSEESQKQSDEAIRPKFQTKLEIGEELVSQSVATIRKVADKQIQLAFDVGYVSEDLLKTMEKLGVKVVTRLKNNANLCEIPQKPTEAKRGRPRIYGDFFKLQDWVENDKEEIFSTIWRIQTYRV